MTFRLLFVYPALKDPQLRQLMQSPAVLEHRKILKGWVLCADVSDRTEWVAAPSARHGSALIFSSSH